MHIMLSNYENMRLPREGQRDQDLTKNYRNSLLCGFKKPGSKNLQYFFPPSTNLHLSKISPSISKDNLKILFSSNSGIV